jgi:hypothetical protein
MLLALRNMRTVKHISHTTDTVKASVPTIPHKMPAVTHIILNDCM